MKLPDFLNFDPFNQLRSAMIADALSDFNFTSKSNALTYEELERLANAGIEIDLKEVRVLSDGTLAYKDSRVLLYIRDISDYRGDRQGTDNLSKFHVSDCSTLKDMRERNR